MLSTSDKCCGMYKCKFSIKSFEKEFPQRRKSLECVQAYDLNTINCREWDRMCELD
jgi:hypothetical protein